ncbi:MAG TPA: TIM barrel protein [Chryseolinea sp.]|nr:TIM barrel protein [Chryseolinea sp.]
MNTRRNFLAAIGGAGLLPFISAFSKKDLVLPISCNSYTWFTFYSREGKEWWQDPDACASEFLQSGLTAIEPSLSSAEDAVKMIAILKKHNIQLPSIYVNSLLHKTNEASKSIDTALSIAREVKKYNTKIIVTNPNPIQWGGPAVKSDSELLEQSANLEQLGKELRKLDMILAYHTHDTEMLAGAREFHHMLQNTSPENVRFCFDVHWMYRGSQNSQVAVFNTLKMYGGRIVELHIRQSVDGVWSETFGNGDIDYKKLVGPHLVIEQCIEDKSPNTMRAVDAHKIDLAEVKKIFNHS